MTRVLAAFAVILTLLTPEAVLAQGASDIFTMARVPVEATAASAEQARLIAQDRGRARAFQLLLRRLTRSSDWPYLPRPRLSELLNIQVGFEVENERFSTLAGDENNYLANITYSFRRDRVRALLRDESVPFSESQASPALVLAVFEFDGERVLWGDDNPWAANWYQTDLTHDLVPLIMPLGDLSDTTVVSIQDVIAGNWAALRFLATRYNVSRIFVAHATLTRADQNFRLYARMTEFSANGVGQVVNTQTNGVPGIEETGTLGSMGSRAIALLSGQLQERWKRQTLVSYDELHQLQATARFNNLDEWLTIRNALDTSATVTEYDTHALSSRGAQVAVTFVGTPQQLMITLGQRGVALSGTRGYWDLSAQGAALRELPPPVASSIASGPSAQGTFRGGSLPPVQTVVAQEEVQQNAPVLSQEDLNSIFGSEFTEEEIQERRRRGLGDRPGTMVPIGD